MYAEIWKSSEKERLEINTVTKMKNIFDGLISSRVDKRKDSELEGISTEISKTKKQGEQRLKKKKTKPKNPEQNIQGLGAIAQSITYIMRIPAGEERKE